MEALRQNVIDKALDVCRGIAPTAIEAIQELTTDEAVVVKAVLARLEVKGPGRPKGSRTKKAATPAAEREGGK